MTPFATRHLPRTLEARFLATALVGVMLPLVLIGVWLTRSAERSGRELLRGQLSRAMESLSGTVEKRWDLRAGELRLIANNGAARRLLTAEYLDRADSTYLELLTKELEHRFTGITYSDTAGITRWAAQQASPRPGTRNGGALQDSIRMEAPVNDNGAVVGRALTFLRISSLVSVIHSDSYRPIPS
jgi:hypothetical protein